LKYGEVVLEELFLMIESITQRPVQKKADTVTDIAAKAIEVETISLGDAWQLLNIDVLQQSELASRVLAAAREKKAQRFNGTVFSISPLYVTSVCREHCAFRQHQGALDTTRGGSKRRRSYLYL
jgi:2-iminoacetate synthase ThiH